MTYAQAFIQTQAQAQTHSQHDTEKESEGDFWLKTRIQSSRNFSL